ncbi:MAG TPA: hypothetical protein DIW50_12510 [Prolixibacteraceae bacterium]|nr:MAG: hypothetical protein A2Z83_00025 [Omnitrophica bacterium GWA2_52_8]HCR91251.1 hypothetical protein [Prolixibacteraceae bacterium]
MKPKVITIIGLGLMGGSLAARCRKRYPSARIIGVSRQKQALALALRKKWIHRGTRNLSDAVIDSDLIVLCTPADTTFRFLKLLDAAAKPGAVVTDVGSVKERIQAWADSRRFKRIRFVGGHPMAGSHHRGIAAAHEDLYHKSTVFLVKSAATKPDAFRLVRSFWKQIGCRTVTLTGAAHDRIVAEISHWPHAVAAALVLATTSHSRRYAASGFLDSTRIAQGDPSIWMPIFMQNRREILRAAGSFEKRLRAFKTLLAKKNVSGIRAFLAQALRERRQISF